MSQATQSVALLPHPGAPAVAHSLTVEIARRGDALRLRYLLAADPAKLRIPPPRPAMRVDGLWRHTCFEVFLASGDSRGYREFNFSPSGEWAAYAFADYRRGGAPLECAPPGISLHASAQGMQLAARVACAGTEALRLAVSAVVEAADGTLGYWALRHPSPQPDFHHAGAFILRVDEERH